MFNIMFCNIVFFLANNNIYKTSSKFSDNVSSGIYNDDLGNDCHASTTKELSKDIQYLVVYLIYNIHSQSGDWAFKINKV